MTPMPSNFFFMGKKTPLPTFTIFYNTIKQNFHKAAGKMHAFIHYQSMFAITGLQFLSNIDLRYLVFSSQYVAIIKFSVSL